MKLRRLPETDLARIAPLAASEKRKRLETHKLTGGAWSYDPAKTKQFTLANPTNPLGLRSAGPTIEQVKLELAKQCYCKDQLESCREIIDLFGGWLKAEAQDAYEARIPDMAVGALGNVRYWENFALVIEGRSTFIWSDCRRQRGLSEIGRKFAFSMMHEQIRIGYPDFFDANLCILQYPSNDDNSRYVKPHFVPDSLFDLKELSSMVEETYAIWSEVLDERRYEEPKRAVGGLF